MSAGPSRTFSVGASIPALDPHAISVSLPTWNANVAYQQGDPSVVDRMLTGYPRFVIHRAVVQLAAIFLREAGTDHEKCLLFPTARYASECRAFILAQFPNVPPSHPVRQVRFPISSEDPSAAAVPSFDLHVVLFPSSMFGLAKQFWQHTGFGISSRLAERCLELLVEPESSPTMASLPAFQIRNSSPKCFAKPLSPSTNGNLFTVKKSRIEERPTDHEASCSPVSAKAVLKSRIAGLLVRDDFPIASVQDRVRKVNGDDVFLYPTGMTAIWHAHQLVMAVRPVEKCVCFGFPYTDTLKVLEKWGPGCHFFGHGPDSDIVELEAFLASSSDVPPFSALFCEFPSNPRLQAPRLDRLRALADRHDFLIVLDDTVGNFANVDVLPYVDILATSLSKFFSGSANVLGGSLVFNSRMRHYKALKVAQFTAYADTYFGEDAVAMELNSRDFALRMRTINANTEKLCDFLRSRSLLASPTDQDLVIKEVFYPKWTTRESYDICRLKRYQDGQAADDNFGGLFSLIFVSALAAHTFFDALPCAKGPSLGTNFTLVCPYTILAHYAERDWAAEYGVDEDLVRVSVGLEDHAGLVADFDFALREAEEAVRRFRGA